LFAGGNDLQALLVSTVAAAPASATPLEMAAQAIEAAGTLLQGRREFSLRRQKVIAANPNLQERELSKLASLAGALAEALRDRGVEDTAANLAAEVAIAVFRTAFERWHEENARRDLTQLVRESFGELKTLTAV
jgi:hypothetical protein